MLCAWMGIKNETCIYYQWLFGKRKNGIYNLYAGSAIFSDKGENLIILCEEGENEYDPALLKRSNACLELIEQEEDFTPEKLLELEKR